MSNCPSSAVTVVLSPAKYIECFLRSYTVFDPGPWCYQCTMQSVDYLLCWRSLLSPPTSCLYSGFFVEFSVLLIPISRAYLKAVCLRKIAFVGITIGLFCCCNHWKVQVQHRILRSQDLKVSLNF